MECVCGCGREIPKKFVDRNFIAAAVALELLTWDKNRAFPGPGPEGREGLIARGAECYERLLYSLHGEGGGDPDEGCNAWLNESTEMRADRPEMTKRKLVGPGAPNLSPEDMERLDRRHPERSYTGGGAAARSSAAAGTGPEIAAADDLVGKLERLRALRDDDVLTDEEFAAAKARLLGRD
ncbi:MAG TPA: SHOCT domain-containing protein [Solirubrobacterales bacterium]|jgi:hypothetical protein